MPAENHSPSNCLDLLRLSPREQEDILTRIDGQTADVGVNCKRTEPRYPYRLRGGLMVSVEHPGGSRIGCLVRTRNLSRSGLGFLHGGFLHRGTRCSMLLRNVDADDVTSATGTLVEGAVMHCRHIVGRVHEVGVRFDRIINTQDFLAGSEQDASLSNGVHADGGRVRGEVVYLDRRDDQRELVRFQLAEMGTTVQTAGEPAEVASLGTEGTADLAILGMDELDAWAVDAVRRLRGAEGGFPGPILLWAANDSPQLRREAQRAGCDFVLVKGDGFAALADAVRKYLHASQVVTEAGTVLESTLWSSTKLRPLILNFLEQFEEQVCRLEHLIETGQLDESRALLAEIVPEAANFGYPTISGTMAELDGLLAAGAEPADPELRDLTRQIAEQCEQACGVRAVADGENSQ